MKSRQRILLRALISGSIAAVTSTAALTFCSWVERGRPAAASNGPSQWVWGERAGYTRRLSVRHTLVGYGIHHAMSVFWAILHESAFGSRRRVSSKTELVVQGLTTAASSCIVDYRVAPKRLQPGFDKHLSTTSMAVVYAAFGLGLVTLQLMDKPKGSARRKR